jgi:hypothetical protein
MHPYTVKVEAECSSETLATICQTERQYHCKYIVLCNLKSRRPLGLSVSDRMALLSKIREVLADGIERK